LNETSEKFKRAQLRWSYISRNGYWPIVKFDNGRIKMLTPEKWERMDATKTLICREQVPLDLAWAITIHKSQGMTINNAYISIKNCFSFGQVS